MMREIYRTGLDIVKERGIDNPAVFWKSFQMDRNINNLHFVIEKDGMTEKRKLSRGFLIAIEGIDGAGKTSQARLLCEDLFGKGYDAIYLREPTDGPYGKKIRALAIEGRHNITPYEEFNLFLNDRREDVEKNIRPALAAGKIVVIDRYFYSSIAYQGALGLDPEFINSENRKIAITPELMIYLSIPSELTTHRIEQSRGDSVNLFEKMEYLEKVKAIFDSMKYPEVVKVNGEGTKEQIHKRILEKVKELIDSLDE